MRQNRLDHSALQFGRTATMKRNFFLLGSRRTSSMKRRGIRLNSDLEELQAQNPPRIPSAVRFLIAGLLGASLAALIVVSTSPFAPPPPDPTPFFDAGFAAGSEAGDAELGQRLLAAGRQGYLDGIREAASSRQTSPSLGSSISDSVPQVNAAILTSGTATEAFRQGYQDGLRVALDQGAATMEAP